MSRKSEGVKYRDVVLTVFFAFLGRLRLLSQPRVQPRCCLGVVAAKRRQSERQCDRWQETRDLAEKGNKVGGFLIQPQSYFAEER